MMRWGAALLAALVWSSAAFAASGDVLVVATKDAELSNALVRAASQQFSGPVALAPPDWSGPVQQGTLRLQVQRSPKGWKVTLAGPEAAVSRTLVVRSTVQLDIAESIALALPGLEARLSARRRAVEEARVAAARAKIPPSAPKPPPPPPPPPVEPPKPAVVPAVPETKPTPTIASIILQVQPSRPSLSFSLLGGQLIARHLGAVGSAFAAQLSFHGPWLARLSIGGFASSFHDTQLLVVPVDALLGAEFIHGPITMDVAAGAELTMAASPRDSAAATTLIFEGTMRARVWRALSIGVRASFAYTTDAAEVDDSIGHDVYIPQSQLRLGLITAWEFD